MKETISHEEIRNAIAEIYNSFYRSNRHQGRRRTLAEWEKINQEVEQILKKYDSIFVEKILEAFIEEFMREDLEFKEKVVDKL